MPHRDNSIPADWLGLAISAIFAGLILAAIGAVSHDRADRPLVAWGAVLMVAGVGGCAACVGRRRG